VLTVLIALALVASAYVIVAIPRMPDSRRQVDE
jgi:hypothetical protein